MGKSCLLMQFTDQKFRPGLDPTIGVESSSRIITIDDDTPTKLEIRDMTGQEAFRRYSRSFYLGAAAAILVYDVTRRDTFDHVGSWLKEAKELAPANLTVILVGNKCDLLPQERAVSYEEGQEGLPRSMGSFSWRRQRKRITMWRRCSLRLPELCPRNLRMVSSMNLQSLVV